jgi:predicted ATPase/DNA-binding SARP family transcriptional activator
MDFRILGPVEAASEGRPLPLGPPKQRAVLVELLRNGGALRREQLIESLWSDEPPKSAVGSLQVYVHGLRRALGSERIETIGTAYRLRLEPEDSVDADELARLVGRARAALAQERAAAALTDLSAALDLWRGAALADVAGLGELGLFARELEEKRLDALELRNEAWLALGHHDLVLEEIDRLIEGEPFRERLRAQQILALYRDGRQAEALAAYRSTRDVWSDELGLEPTRELRDLERAVLRHDETLAAPGARQTVRHRFPAPPTALVGRGLEIASVAALLRGQARLVTLLGPGGTGKTRLAIALAEELELEFRDGVVFVDLSPVADPQLLVPTIAEAIELSADADAVPEHLAERELLLVLDNVEQIVDAADDVAALLAAAPRLRVLATSRTPLRLTAEHEYHVRPLPVPRANADEEELAQTEAVQLFLARARAAGRELGASADVGALCRRLDGLPLALELAAARTKLLSPSEILTRLEREPTQLASPARDVPARHSTLAATIQWSLDLLDEPARRAFARLGVFAGGCTIDAASHVGVDVDSLGTLVDMSLLQRQERAGHARLVMLETVRAFASERLEAGGGEETRLAHALWLTELAEQIEAELTRRGNTAERLDELEAELDNIRAALEWTAHAGHVDVALRLISATRPVWEIRGHLREGSRWVDEVLAAADDGWPELRAKALGFAGTAALRRGSIDEASARWQEMLELYEALGDREGIARGLSDVGTAAAARGDWERSSDLLERAATIFRELGASKRLAIALANLGHVAGHLGDLATAHDVTVEALELERGVGDEQRQAISLNNLGGYAAEAGDHDGARHWLGECIALARKVGYREVLAHALVTHARMALTEGDAAEAARYAAAADVIFEEAGVQMPGVEGEQFAALKEDAERRLGAETHAAVRAEAARTPVDEILLEAASSRS